MKENKFSENELSESKLICSNLEKSYGKKEVLHDFHLELEKGKIYGLIGRNGAGKTTLLSLISGQNPTDKGTITINGMPVWENPDALQHICFSREINPMNSALSNLKLKEVLRVASIYLPNWDMEMANHLVEEFELDTKQRINKLSKGMLSMVTIILALASKADYTFLDEPVAGLDVVMREHFYRLLLDEFAESGRTFVISTHIIEEASDVFEEVIMIDKGRLLLKENTQDLIDRARHVSGKEEDVDRVVAGLTTYHPEKMGRSKGITVLLKPGETIETDGELSIQPMTLQQIFVALCSKEV